MSKYQMLDSVVLHHLIETYHRYASLPEGDPMRLPLIALHSLHCERLDNIATERAQSKALELFRYLEEANKEQHAEG